MSNLIGRLLVVLALGWGGSVSAVQITDTVIVGSQEWAQVTLFTDVSWNTANSQCPGGPCLVGSQLKGWDLDGWTWASASAVQTLFNTFTGVPISDFFNTAWAPDFYETFDLTYQLFFPGGDGRFIQGVDGFTSNQENGVAIYAAITSGAENDPDFRIDSAVIDVRPCPVDSCTLDDKYAFTGHWMVRDSNPVPTPATLALFGLGLAIMRVTSRKRGAKV